jgi:hypothetical protein
MDTLILLPLSSELWKKLMAACAELASSYVRMASPLDPPESFL